MTKFDRTPIRRVALWTVDKSRRQKLFQAVRELTGEDPWGITDSPLVDNGTLLRKTSPRGTVEFCLSEPTAEELIAELSVVRRTRAFTVVTVLNGDETSRYTRVLVDPHQADPNYEERLATDPLACAVAGHFLNEDAIRGVDITTAMPEKCFGIAGRNADGSDIAVVHRNTLLDMRLAYANSGVLDYALTRLFWNGRAWGGRKDFPVPPLDTGSKEAAVAADIEVKRFIRQRVEYWIPTGYFDGDGGRFEDTGLAYAWARQELVKKGVIKEGDSAEGHVRIKPSDEHVIVYIEFDEEQKK